MAITDPVVGNGEQVRIGPGKIWVAPFGTDLPVTLAEAPDADFREVGFTVEGSVTGYSQTSEQVEVAERLRGIKSIITAVEATFETTFAQLSPQNLAIAMNAGAESIQTTADEVVFTWPKAGGTARVSIIWQSDDNLERLVIAKAFAGGDISMPRRKGVEVAGVGVTFTIEENSVVGTQIGDDTDDVFRDVYQIWDKGLAEVA